MADVPPPRRWPALDIRFPPDADASLLTERLYFLLDDFQPTAIQETETETDAEADTGAHVGWRVFFGSSDARDKAAAALAAMGAPDSLLTAIAIDIDDDNWAARSQASLRAVRVGDVIVAPPWDARAAVGSTIQDVIEVGLEGVVEDGIQDVIQIIIMPSMGFGTGHHASTRLCLTALQTRRLDGARVLDVGTGSGVLAIAAARLGGASVLGIDNDADAIASARENLLLNACDSRVTLREIALDRLGDEAPFDVVLANLTWAPLVDQAPLLKRLLNRAGVLIASGFTLDEEDRVRSAYGELVVDGRWTEETWVALAFGPPSPPNTPIGVGRDD